MLPSHKQMVDQMVKEIRAMREQLALLLDAVYGTQREQALDAGWAAENHLEQAERLAAKMRSLLP